MITLKSPGKFVKTLGFLDAVHADRIFTDLNRYGRQGVDALRASTPVESGLTAESWAYKLVKRKGNWFVEWFNTNVHEGVNVAVILQYGHATRTGGYVKGIDYINPALKPIFDALSENVWKKVTSA